MGVGVLSKAILLGGLYQKQFYWGGGGLYQKQFYGGRGSLSKAILWGGVFIHLLSKKSTERIQRKANKKENKRSILYNYRSHVLSSTSNGC